jgi:hypothetical protein
MGVMGVVGSVGMSAVGGHCRAVNGSDGCSGECGHECCGWTLQGCEWE